MCNFVIKMALIAFVLQLSLPVDGLSPISIIDQNIYISESVTENHNANDNNNNELYTEINELDKPHYDDDNPTIVIPTRNDSVTLQRSSTTSGTSASIKSALLKKLSNKLSAFSNETYVNYVNNMKKNAVSADITVVSTNVVPQDGNKQDYASEEDEIIDANDLKKLLTKYDSDDGHSCLLDNIKDNLLWWTHSNGTLRTTVNLKYSGINYMDFSHNNLTDDDALLHKMNSPKFDIKNVIIFSAAFNDLSITPYKSLLSIRNSLKYLTLRGNKFIAFTAEILEEGIAWATFPELPALSELDISSCNIQYLTREAFRNVKNLRRLYISNNKIMRVPFDTFFYIQKLQYLDMSFTNVLSRNYQVSTPTIELVLNLVNALKIQQFTFKMLPELLYLDISHTKISRNSAMAFAHLGSKLKYLSLCYTAFPMVGNALFKNTALEGLDLSGNPMLSYNMMDDAFESIADTLRYLYFESSSLKDLDWLRPLSKLRVLGLAGNNINAMTVDSFKPLKNIQVVDLSSNHVGNWYKRAFEDNAELRVLNLRDNNINILTTEMLKDFERLNYLSIGDNNFLCDCLLRDLIDVAASNNKDPECAHALLHDVKESLINEVYRARDYVNRMSQKQSDMLSKGMYKLPSIENINVERNLWMRFALQLKLSYQNIKGYQRKNNIFKLRFFKNAHRLSKCTVFSPMEIGEKLNDTKLKFQLLDYEEEHYWCYNETEQMHVGKLNCQARILSNDITAELQSMTNTVFVIVGTIAGISIFAAIIYLKRWHIHYYYSSLKSAALLSVASKEAVNKFNELVSNGPNNMVYDIFISYCQSDRQWILDELLPNVEESGDISICLHERDFRIGVAILDNIVSCMDRSRSLMLIISRKFLLSHWCQFEMYLAHHRILDAQKEHLILVLLEDIPRTKRPKALQYLMDIKTYIKWPSSKGKKHPKPEERKLFWKRLRRSLKSKGIGIGDFKTGPSNNI